MSGNGIETAIPIIDSVTAELKSEISTRVMCINPPIALKFMAAALIPNLSWRHNGQGMLQAYIYEGSKYESRLHIWHPSLRLPGIELNGLIHDHRFNMRVTLLRGSVMHTEFMVTPDEDSKCQVVEVLHARAAKEQTGIFHRYPMVTGKRVRLDVLGSWKFYVGHEYYFPKRHFHRTFADQFAITLVEKFDQEETPPANLIDTGKHPLINSFENTMTNEFAFVDILDLAMRELRI